MSEYIFEKVTPDHYHLLKDLYFDAFSLSLDIPAIQKRLNTSVLGFEYIGYIAIHSETGKVAAHYGVFPVMLAFNNHSFWAAQGVDAMTHSKHRLKGLFVRLGELILEECRKKNVHLLFSFPNKNSFTGFTKNLKWIQIDSIQRLDLKLKIKTIPLPKIFKHSSFLQKVYLAYSKFILRKKIIPAPFSFNNTYPSSYAKVCRDEKYIAFKKASDKFFIKIDDQVLWIRLTDVLWIGDFSNYKTVNNSFIKKIKKLAFFLGYNTVSFHINESVQLPAFLNSFKKYNTEPSCVFFINDSIKPENILYTGADFDTW